MTPAVGISKDNQQEGEIEWRKKRRSRGRDALRSTCISFEDNNGRAIFFLPLSSLSVRGNQREENKARRAAAAG